jgi:amino acid adenylation domain-containing protein
MQVGEIWANIFGLNVLQVDDNYYELGGDSIIAITLASRINRLLGIQTTPIDILRQPVLSSFVASIVEKYCAEISATDTSSVKDEPIKDKKREYYDVSSAQKRSYILNSLNPDDTRYNEPIVLLFHGYVDHNRVQDAFNQMIERHEILRTSYQLVGNRPMQRIHDIHQIVVSYTAAEGEEESYEKCIRDWIKPFDLGVAPLLRVHLHRLKADRYLLFLDVHHSITDGRSSEIMVHEFMRIYQGLPLLQLTAQYKDYAKWHNDLLKSPDMEKQETFWIETLKGEVPVLRLPCRHDRHLYAPESGGTKTVTLSTDQAVAIRAVAAQSNTTPFNVFLSALYILLYNYTGQDDIWIGTPVSERSLPWMDQIIGFIINSIVLRNFPKGDIVYKDFLNDVSRNTLEAFSHRHYPFDMLVEKIIQDRIVDKNPLFDIMIVMQKMQNSKNGLSETDDFSIEQVSVSTGRAKVALTLDIREYEDYFTIEFEYAAALFDEDMIEGLMRHYTNLLQACLSTPSRRLCDLAMMEEEEKDAILYHLNSPVALSERHDDPVIHYFQLSAEKRPQSTAIIHGDKSITYAELNGRVDALAYQMQKRGVGFNHIIAILVKNPAETLTSVLAVLKAGGAFFVVDTRLPSARMEHLLYDTNPSLILACDAYTRFLTGLSYPFIQLEEAFISEKEEPLVSYTTPEDAAYIIYTSGTTGTPKGILVSNGQLTNQVMAIMKEIPYNEQTRHAFTIEFSFDPFIQVFLCILCAGGCLHLMPNELVTDPRSFYRYVEKHGINSMDMVPSLLSSHLAGIQPESKLRLDILTLAGEVFSETLYEKINACFDVKNLFNVYGPAETVVNTTIYKCGGETDGASVPIGKPIENYCVYILDKHLRPLPVNVEGELYISGASVAMGYLNKPTHTRENFIENPFLPKMRMYRTGDIGKWLPDGNIIFVGRNDKMVKIRGMRVEIQEVQRVIQNIEGIKLAEVIPYKEESDTYLCAYIVRQPEISQEIITDYLYDQLPAYMVPAYFVFLPELPYNMNGKLDIRNLPHPKKQKASVKITREPMNDFEKRLCEIWAEILNVPVSFIDPAKSFFAQGGNSLSIIILQRELEQALSREIPIPALFSYSTIQTFQRYWQSQDAGAHKAENFGYLSCLTLPDEWILYLR